MKRISLSLPEKEYPFFLKLVKNLSFVKVEKDVFYISEDEKNLVRRRIKNSTAENLKNWDVIKNSFKGA